MELAGIILAGIFIVLIIKIIELLCIIGVIAAIIVAFCYLVKVIVMAFCYLFKAIKEKRINNSIK